MSDFNDEIDDWDWREDDENGERAIPRITKLHTLGNSLQPTPPIGWLKMFRYDAAPPVETTEAASWMLCVATVQNWERHQGRVRQAHMICRDLKEHRVLVVHPDLQQEAEDTIEALNGILCHCSCGGFDCIEPTLQRRAALLFARRSCALVDPAKLEAILAEQELDPALLRWSELSLPERAKLITDERLDPDAIAEDRHWLDVIQSDSGTLYNITLDMCQAAGRVAFYQADTLET